MRVLIVDANVLISAAVFGGTPREFLLAATEKHHLAMPTYTVGETRSRLRLRYQKKFRHRGSLPELEARLELLLMAIQFREPRNVPKVGRDFDDACLLGLAGEMDATIVTGDKDLLVLHPYEGIDILTPGDALQSILGSETV